MMSYCSSGSDTVKSFLKKYYRTLLVFLAAAMLFWACEEGPTSIGSGFLPDGDFASVISASDISIDAYTMYDDSVRTSDSLYMFGKRYNPYFGTTRVELVTQLNLLFPWPERGFTIDSVSMVLAISQYEGDTLFTQQQIEVFEISEFLYRDSTYYSNKPVQIKRSFGSYIVDSLKSDTIIEIKLPNSIGEYLLRDTTKLFISSTEPDFRDFFRGLYFRFADSPYDAFMNLSSSQTTSGIQIYFRDDAGMNATYSFVLSDKSARYRVIEHDFSTADPARSVKNINNFVKDTLVYQQTLDGVYTRLEFPGLAQFKDYLPASVNMARLILPVHLDDDVFTDNKVPKNLYLRYTDSDGNKLFLPDALMNLSYFGGNYSVEDDEYVINMAVFVQEYLEGRIEEPVVEIVLPASAAADLVLKANDAVKGPQLQLTISKF
jgi:hypothetical protein